MVVIPNCIKLDKIRGSRLNKRELKEVRAFLIVRDGEKCSELGCRQSPPFDVHHRDGNKHRHYHENLELMCHKHNCREHRKAKLTGFSLPLTDTQPAAGDTKLYLKKKYLLDFLNYLEEVFENETELEYKKLIRVGAFRAGMANKKTIEEYVELLSCGDPASPLLTFKDERTEVEYVCLRYPPVKVSALFKELRRKYCG